MSQPIGHFDGVEDQGYIHEDLDDSILNHLSETSKIVTKHPHARRSVEEYLEHRRLKEQYASLFDDYFGEKNK